MQGLGGFLNKNTAVGTNKPATNAPPTKNPFKGLLGQ
jgi:hypothetical protein